LKDGHAKTHGLKRRRLKVTNTSKQGQKKNENKNPRLYCKLSNKSRIDRDPT